MNPFNQFKGNMDLKELKEEMKLVEAISLLLKQIPVEKQIYLKGYATAVNDMQNKKHGYLSKR